MGAGQSEVEVIGIADVVLLVLMPGSGDSVQALKAGIMEIPDVIAVNKMDHPAANAMVKEVRSVVALEPERARRPQILLTEALREARECPSCGPSSRAAASELVPTGRLEERRRRNLARRGAEPRASRGARRDRQRAVDEEPALGALVERVQRRELDPLTAVGGDRGTRCSAVDGDGRGRRLADVRGGAGAARRASPA